MKIIKNIVTCVLFIFFMVSCSNSADKARIAYLEEQIEELKSSQNSSETQNTSTYNQEDNVTTKSSSSTNIIEGTYEVVDNIGSKWIIILNSDESVNIHREGSDVVAYGSWSNRISNDGSIWLAMDENPRIVFPNMEEGFSGHGDINGDYLYREVNSAKSKNPNQRLQLRKIK
ncbi:MAG: hypothetical protein J1E63_09580 [Muribaculaceae bacterium]|nr:hypothetical protein [Muribaculaceae bacterium]